MWQPAHQRFWRPWRRAIAGIKTADVLGLILRVKSQREASAL